MATWRCGGGFAVTREELRQRLTMGQVEPAASRHQELAAGGRHRVVNGDVSTALRKHLSGHQAGGAGADDRGVFGRR